MAVSVRKENFVLHKIHSLTGIVPVGYYVVQHLVLNTFSLAGPTMFNDVIGFFESMPKFLLLAIELVAIWIPLLFHAIYGLFIVDRAQPNYFTRKYKWSQNRMYTLQRWSGIFLFFFLIIHFATTTGYKYLTGNSDVIKFAAWHGKLTEYYGIWLIFYVVGVFVASYHLCYGLWNFCIRWGITVSDKAQVTVQKFSFVAFILLTLIGWGALVGFLIPHGSDSTSAPAPVPAPTTTAAYISARPF